MFDGKLTNWVVKQLKANSEQPFFLACGFTKPHLPWTVPSKYFDLHPLDEISLPIVPKDDLADIPAISMNRDNTDRCYSSSNLCRFTFSIMSVGPHNG